MLAFYDRAFLSSRQYLSRQSYYCANLDLANLDLANLDLANLDLANVPPRPTAVTPLWTITVNPIRSSSCVVLVHWVALYSMKVCVFFHNAPWLIWGFQHYGTLLLLKGVDKLGEVCVSLQMRGNRGWSEHIRTWI